MECFQSACISFEMAAWDMLWQQEEMNSVWLLMQMLAKIKESKVGATSLKLSDRWASLMNKLSYGELLLGEDCSNWALLSSIYKGVLG